MKWTFRILRWTAIIWAGFTIPDIYDIGGPFAPEEWYMDIGYPKVEIAAKDTSKKQEYEIKFQLDSSTTVREVNRKWETVSDVYLQQNIQKTWQEIVSKSPHNLGAAMRNQLLGAFTQTVSRFMGTVAGFFGGWTSEHWATSSNVELFPVGPVYADYTCLKACLIIGRIAGWCLVVYAFILPYRFWKICTRPSTLQPVFIPDPVSTESTT